MSPKSLTYHLYASNGRPGRGVGKEGERAPPPTLREMWRSWTKGFSKKPRPPGADSALPRDTEIPESQQKTNIHEMDGNPPGPGSRHEGPHHGTQAQHPTEMPETTPVPGPDYRPPPPPGPGQQVCTGPPGGSPDTDIIIALMGVTGAGKSYFIREVSGNSQVEVSHDLNSFDTPGFNDTNRSDTEVLREIADWTTRTYEKKRLLSGIVYLHPITHARMEGSALRNLGLFRSLCGQKALENVLLTTTQWSNVDPVEGGAREQSLREQKFWGGLIDKGATLQRFSGTRESGLELIRKLMRKDGKPLDIQVQIVNERMTLLETDAGKCIGDELAAQAKRHKEKIEVLKKEWEDELKEAKKEIESLLEVRDRELKKAQEDIEKVLAEKELLEKMHAEELKKIYAEDLEKLKEREAREEKERLDRAVIAVATKDIEVNAHVARGLTTYNTRGRLIFDTNNREEFGSSTFRITIHYVPRNSHDVQVHTKTNRGMFDAGVGAANYIIWRGVHYQRKSSTYITRGGQDFFIFSKA
ncbi:hypothetical protein C7212DRAFT_361948 [Tuber magnatum]|uniref:G domain-containing protein n=1 Tax=Tuber magnatum TaxID=42249 RepID=A0A317SZY2_9PEZI|nr:hypothetical protein C7212DRAFT_361948 [Tuber magnatum]